MNLFKRLKTEGVSLKGTHILMIIATVVILALLLYDTFRSESLYKQLSVASDNYIELQKSADDLMNAVQQAR